ncbi:hypothetical protein Hanom_Chr05g00422251 [Helianthus anomalus]
MINGEHKYLFNGIAMLFDCRYGHGCSFFIRVSEMVVKFITNKTDIKQNIKMCIPGYYASTANHLFGAT